MWPNRFYSTVTVITDKTIERYKVNAICSKQWKTLALSLNNVYFAKLFTYVNLMPILYIA